MSKYRNLLPQISGKKFITEGGLETTLVFHDGIELPNFAAFSLLKTIEGENRLKEHYRQYADIAIANKVGFILDSVTWRASSDWGALMGYSDIALDAINKQSVKLLDDLRDELETDYSPMVISGCIGPRSDGYNPDFFMSIEEAKKYHATQIKSFNESSADMVTAMTITYVEEAIGIVKAAKAENIPVANSSTINREHLNLMTQSFQLETISPGPSADRNRGHNTDESQILAYQPRTRLAGSLELVR